MLDLAYCVRALQFYAQHAHHIVARVVFGQDHKIFEEIYEGADTHYDHIIERFIGLHGSESLDEQKVLSMAVQKVAGLPLKDIKENKEALKTCLDLIKECNGKIEVICKDPKTTQGTIQLLGDIANDNEVLVYKLQQRLK